MSYYLFRFCGPDHTKTVNLYDAVIVGFRYLPQLLQIRPDERWPALAENPKDLRRFHPYFVINIMQKFLKYRHMIFINVGRLRSDVF